MVRPGLITALLLPLPFAALPLIAVLMGGPTSPTRDEAAYVPVIGQADKDTIASLKTSWYTLTAARAAAVDNHGCDDLLAES